MKRTSIVNRGPIFLTGLLLAAQASAQAFPLPAQNTTQTAPRPAPAQSTTPPANQSAALVGETPALAPQPPSNAPPPVQGPPPAAAEPVWIGAVTAPPIAAPPQICTPACRPGFLCLSGGCVTACNPRCSNHEYCTETGVCRTRIKPGAHRHDGPLLRAGGGPLIASLTANSLNASRDLTDQTVTGNISVDGGGAVIENLIVRGRFQGSVGYLGHSPFGGDVIVLYGAMGVGADYYFMPINLYVGGTLSLTGASVSQINNLDLPPEQRNNHVRHSGPGFGLDFDIGKEWWVSGNWGVGLAFRMRYLDMAPSSVGLDRQGRLTSFQYGLMFSATYN
jgi:hypothetical protein